MMKVKYGDLVEVEYYDLTQHNDVTTAELMYSLKPKLMRRWGVFIRMDKKWFYLMTENDAEHQSEHDCMQIAKTLVKKIFLLKKAGDLRL